jgi:hypothetical protein
MRWLTLLVVAVLALAGCAGSDDEAVTDTSPRVDTTRSDIPPRTYQQLLARLPPLDEPASPEVSAYRKATIGADFERCVLGTEETHKATFVRANKKVLDLAAPPRNARFVSEASVPRRDGNGCFEGTGPPTYYTTDRTYRLPTRTTPAAVFGHYERVLRGWLEASGTTECDRWFSHGPAYVVVDACNGMLRLTALGRAPLVPASTNVPPRPYGGQYPIAADYLAIPKPTSSETEPGESCERASGADVPSVIVPPPPGVRADLRDEQVLVEWSFGRIQGDCPPTQVVLAIVSPNQGTPPLTIRVDVRAHTGTAGISVPAPFREASVLRAASESVDGARSRVVAILIRRPQ